jgi:hypothetical protein
LDKTNGQPQLKVQVRLFRDGQPLFTGKEIPLSAANQTDLKRITTVGALQLGTQMQPGEYVLQIIVTDLIADGKYRTAAQSIDFDISP